MIVRCYLGGIDKISRQTKTTKRVVEETPIIKNKKKDFLLNERKESEKQNSAKSKLKYMLMYVFSLKFTPPIIHHQNNIQHY